MGIAAMAIVIAVALAACSGGGSGGSGGSTAADSGGSTGSASASSGEKVKIVMAHGLAETNPSAIMMIDFKKYLDENYDLFDIEIYPLAQLGNEREMIESTQAGSIQVVACSTSPYTGFTKDSGIFNIPWAMHSYDELDAVLTDDEFIAAFDESFEAIGLKIGALMGSAFRNLETIKPVRHVEDFKGLNMRVMEIDAHIETFKDLGCMTTALPFAELQTALQQGLVDGHDSNFSLALSNSLGTQYLTKMMHLPGVVPYTMNLEWFNGLTTEQQDAIMEAWDYALSQIPDMEQFEIQCKDDLLASYGDGAEYFEFTEEDIAKAEELVQPAWEIVKGEVRPELYEAYFAAIERAR
jgi:TRAP-type C4-dicarboxylate transport system substrate-binding protein